MEGGTLLRVLFFLSVLGVIASLATPFLIQDLLLIDSRKAQTRAEIVILQAAQWYVNNNGAPQNKMETEDVKKALIPYYLNQWPGKERIECTIDTDGKITINEKKYNTDRSFRLLEIFQKWIKGSNP